MKTKKPTGYEKTVLAVTYDVEKDVYNIGACQGSSVSEMAFAVMAIIRTLVRDGHIKDDKEFMDLVQKYLDDEQYGELK